MTHRVYDQVRMTTVKGVIKELDGIGKKLTHNDEYRIACLLKRAAATKKLEPKKFREYYKKLVYACLIIKQYSRLIQNRWPDNRQVIAIFDMQQYIKQYKLIVRLVLTFSRDKKVLKSIHTS